MKTRTKRLLVVAAAVLFAIGCSVAGWATLSAVAWARDLPNRVVIDGDAIANAFGQAAVESYHFTLRDGDATVQLQVLDEQFASLVRQNGEGAAWIQNEFGDDIVALVDSDNTKVSNAASNLISMLDAGTQTPNAR